MEVGFLPFRGRRLPKDGLRGGLHQVSQEASAGVPLAESRRKIWMVVMDIHIYNSYNYNYDMICLFIYYLLI